MKVTGRGRRPATGHGDRKQGELGGGGLKTKGNDACVTMLQ